MIIKTLKLEHQQEIEELRKSKSSTPLIKADELDPSPRTIRGGTLSPSSVLTRSLMYMDDEEKERLSERKRSLDLLAVNRHDTTNGSPLGVSGTPKQSGSTAIATDDALEPVVLTLPPTPPPRVSSNGRPPLPSDATQQQHPTSNSSTNALKSSNSVSVQKVDTAAATVKPPTESSAAPSTKSPSGSANQGNACCVVS